MPTLHTTEAEDVMTAESYWHYNDPTDVSPSSLEEDLENDWDPQIDIKDDKAIIVSNALPRAGQSDTINNRREPWRLVFGLFLAFMSGLIFTANNVAIQTLSLDYTDAVIVRGTIQIIFIGLLICLRGSTFWPKFGNKPNKYRILMVLQGVLGGVMVICTYCCVLLLPLGDALTLVFSAPLCTMILAAIFLGQKLRLFKITFGAMLLLGTILVVRPPFLFDMASFVPCSFSRCTSFLNVFINRMTQELLT